MAVSFRPEHSSLLQEVQDQDPQPSVPVLLRRVVSYHDPKVVIGDTTPMVFNKVYNINADRNPCSSVLAGEEDTLKLFQQSMELDSV